MASLVTYASSSNEEDQDDDDMDEVVPEVANNTSASTTEVPKTDEAAGAAPLAENDDDEDDEDEEEDVTPEPSYSPLPAEESMTIDVDRIELGAMEQENDQGDEGEQGGTRSARRIKDLDQVQQDIARLLHFAGCTLASLHPEPLNKFTDQRIPIDGKQMDIEAGDKKGQFDRYAEAYYSTLNDIQLSLRVSIRHLRLSRASPNVLLDPNYSSLLPTMGSESASSSSIGAGGFAHGNRIDPLDPKELKWSNETGKRGNIGDAVEPRLSVAAMEVKAEAWQELRSTLETRKE